MSKQLCSATSLAARTADSDLPGRLPKAEPGLLSAASFQRPLGPSPAGGAGARPGGERTPLLTARLVPQSLGLYLFTFWFYCVNIYFFKCTLPNSEEDLRKVKARVVLKERPQGKRVRGGGSGRRLVPGV